MLLRRLSQTFSKLSKRNHSVSALYITGDKAQDTFAVLNPKLDFDERLKNKIELENNLKFRGIDVNLNELIKLWNFYKHVESKKDELEESRISISQTIKNLSAKGDRYANRIDTLKAHGKMVKEDLKILKEEFWSLEEKAAIQTLSLPNVLHYKTPKDLTVEHSFLTQPTGNSKSHLEIADELDLLEYVNPYHFYFKNDAALYELGLTTYLTNILNEKNYSLFSNYDFSRSVIVEGCGLNFSDPKKVFAIDEDVKHENSRLHLTGSATLTSFMAYFCKHTIFPNAFPLKYFSVGKKYQPPSNDTKSLLNVTQETSVNLFISTKDSQQMDKEFEIILKDAIEIYESLGYHFRVCLLPPQQLQNWESLRASFQLFSSHLNEYVEVGNISLCGDYVSKRLLLNYGRGFDVHYPCIITANLLSVPKMLSCVLESGQCHINLLPDILKKCI